MKRFFLICTLFFTLGLAAQQTPKVNVYPNPASGHIRVTFSEAVQSDITFTISDILGNKIEVYTFKPSESLYIDLQPLNLVNGIYLIKIETGGQLFLKRLMVKNQ